MIMANGDQLKALLRSHAEGDDRHFYSVAMQMAAHEAKQGHGKLAEELRELIDAAKARRNAGGGEGAIPIARPKASLQGCSASPTLRAGYATWCYPSRWSRACNAC